MKTLILMDDYVIYTNTKLQNILDIRKITYIFNKNTRMT